MSYDLAKYVLNVNYGTLSFMFAISGNLHRYHNYFININTDCGHNQQTGCKQIKLVAYISKLWIIGSMIVFLNSSNKLFAKNTIQTIMISIVCIVNMIIMCVFKVKPITKMVNSQRKLK